METTQQPNAEQIALWNGPSARGWIEAQELLDRILQPFEDVLVAAVAARKSHRVLDIGCGTGSTTLAAARQIGTKGRALGVDVSEPMIALAKQRAALERSPASFICADAQTYPFDDGTFDLIISRFGVMFFDDSVRAFANLRRATAKGGELQAIVWRGPAENPFMTAAERAAAPYFPEMPARRPDEPGQFAFADRNRVYSILEKSGWSGIDIRPLDVACVLAEHELRDYVSRLGPLGRMLQQVDEHERARITEAVRSAFDPYVHGDDVRFTAACWIVGARVE